MEPSAPPVAMSRYFSKAYLPSASAPACADDGGQGLTPASLPIQSLQGSRRGMTPRQDSLPGVISCPASGRTAVKGELHPRQNDYIARARGVSIGCFGKGTRCQQGGHGVDSDRIGRRWRNDFCARFLWKSANKFRGEGGSPMGWSRRVERANGHRDGCEGCRHGAGLLKRKGPRRGPVGAVFRLMFSVCAFLGE